MIFDLAAFCLACLALVKFCRFAANVLRTRRPYPPGPPQKWVVGNLTDLPTNNQWHVFTEWSKRYGDIVYARVLHNHIVVVSRLETIIELFERRYNIYSSRTPTAMLDLIGDSHFTSSLPYGECWRFHRRMLQKFLNADAAKSYEGLQRRKVTGLLHLLLCRPDDFLSHIRYEALSIIMSALYDYDVADENDHYLEIAQTAVDKLTKTILPGSFLVNAIPVLRFIPEWFPGGGFKIFARETKALVEQMRDDTIQMVLDRMNAGETLNCIAAKLLKDKKSDDELLDIKSVCATLYAAGAESSVSTIQTFFYAMADHYDVQRRAQAEIDQVIRFKRLPNVEDRPFLPYIEAIYRETLRWHPVFPVGGPHYTTDEDICDGYLIPKGTTVIPNVWGITRDPGRYPDPESFNPSRFFEPNGSLNNDDLRYVFGFGRRICPGQHLASVTVWLTIVNVLATFDIHKKKDMSGQEIPVNSGHTGNALASYPLPFECSITPRSEVAKDLVLGGIAKC